MVKASGPDQVVKLVTLQRVQEETKGDVKSLKKSLDKHLGDPEDLLALDREKAEVQDRLDDLTAVTEDLEGDLQQAKDELEERRIALKLRRGRLKSARELLERKRREMGEDEVALREDATILKSVQSSAVARRTELITLLSSIFPIEPYSPTSTSESSSPDLLFTILSQPLPNSSYPPDMSDDVISSSLGYTAQVVSLLSTYLSVPLHYPIKCLGSRSAVIDLISVMKGPRAFPLYGKGVDRYRFDYGVFLLNKNIEQLMYSQGLTVIDLRNTLPNLKSLVLSLSYDPSHSSFASSTLSVPIHFRPSPHSSDPPPSSIDSLASFDGTYFRRPPQLSQTEEEEPPPSPPPESTEAEEEGEEAHSPSTIRASIFPSPPASPTPNGNGHAATAVEKAEVPNSTPSSTSSLLSKVGSMGNLWAGAGASTVDGRS